MLKSPALLFLALFAACGSKGVATSGTGTVNLVLTDSATDELSQFEVDVRDIVFTKAGGSTVSVMPRTSRIDFLSLESLNELVSARSLEAGLYARLTLTLDFSSARVVIVDRTTPATVKDQNGNTITGNVEVQVDLPSGSRPLIRDGARQLFVLDLDLDQSITVDSLTNTVTFVPVFSLEVDPSNPDPIATTGVLQSVDTGALTFTVERRATDGQAISTFTARAGSSTVFQLGGVVSLGTSGLSALVANIGQQVFVQGTLSNTEDAINAVAVESGAGVPGNGQDWVLGHVVERTGGAGVDAVLTVRGRSLDVGTTTRTYNTLHTVNVSFADTKVLRRGAGNNLDTDAVNVGQLVWIFGDLTGTTMAAATSTGVVRMLRTSIFGIATGAVANDTLTLDVTRFDQRDVSQFNFSVSGQVQADPDQFTVDVTGLSTTGIANGSRLRVLGFLSGIGAVDEDASAWAIVDRSNGAKVLLCAWAPANLGAIDTGASTTSAVTLDVSAALVKVIGDGFQPATLNNAPAPTLRPLAATGFYRIVQDGSVVLHRTFSGFRGAVLERAATEPVLRISAFGTFDAATQALSALSATVVFD